MRFVYLHIVIAALVLASLDAAAQVPANAHSIEMDGLEIPLEEWSCNRGYYRSGDNCIAECKRKPSTCLRTFIRKKDYVSASDLYNKNRDLFRTAKEAKRRSSELDELSRYLNNEYDARIATIQADLVTVSFDAADRIGWGSMTSTITLVDELLADYRSHEILIEEKYAAQSVRDLEAQLQTKIDSFANQRRSAFLAYDHTSAIGFFDVYPGEVIDDIGQRMLARDTWPDLWPIIDSMTKDNQLKLIESWTDGKPSQFHDMFGADLSVAIADSYYRKTVQALTIQEKDVDEFFNAIAAGNAINLTPSEAVSSKLLLVVTAADGDFGLNLDFDKTLPPFSGSQVFPDEAMFDLYDVVILMRVTNAELNERTVSTGTIPSKYEERMETTTNPAYISAQSSYNAAINSYDIAQSNGYRAEASLSACKARTTWCLAESYQAGVSDRQIREAGDALSRTQRHLRNTSPTVTKPVYREYQLPVSSIGIEKVVTGNAALILPAAGEAGVMEFRLVDTKNIDIAINVHPKDSGAAKSYRTPDDLKAEESRRFEVDVLEVISELGTDKAEIWPTEKLDELLALVLKRKQRSAVSVAERNQVTSVSAVKASHPAINGVAVVQTSVGNSGSGFFVADHLLLTNYHVVNDSRYVEIELFDGRSTTGQVINTDIDRDLALVRTNLSGQPLELFAGNLLPLGESVIAIGHPSGLKFTLTKGIISAVREQESTTSVGLGGRFLFVQTDTAISPGNSGGPLLLGNKVIGINTQKLVATSVEGIGFALHYAEIACFLAISMSN